MVTGSFLRHIHSYAILTKYQLKLWNLFPEISIKTVSSPVVAANVDINFPCKHFRQIENNWTDKRNNFLLGEAWSETSCWRTWQRSVWMVVCIDMHRLFYRSNWRNVVNHRGKNVFALKFLVAKASPGFRFYLSDHWKRLAGERFFGWWKNLQTKWNFLFNLKYFLQVQFIFWR